MSFKLPSLRKAASQRRSAPGLPLFKFEKLESKELIGHGSFGTVYKGIYNSQTVVAKQLRGESQEEEDCFIKEARLMNTIDHENVVKFKAFSTTPLAIMMEYLHFDFSLFDVSKSLSNLVEFLNYLDKIDAFGYFSNDMVPKMGYEISKGLEHLHGKGIAHRDLKPKNILVSNQHYCDVEDEEERYKAFAERPVISKLADFGESRSHVIQTRALHSSTKNVDR